MDPSVAIKMHKGKEENDLVSCLRLVKPVMSGKNASFSCYKIETGWSDEFPACGRSDPRGRP